jgi:hypothetical protein
MQVSFYQNTKIPSSRKPEFNLKQDNLESLVDKRQWDSFLSKHFGFPVTIIPPFFLSGATAQRGPGASHH